MEYSFIIPVYNCKDYLSDCVESILAAQAPSCEIILVDDGATDGSGTVCNTLAAQYPVIRVVHQPNSGASAARNRGIQEAQGEKILFFDADDSIDSAALCKILSDPRCDQADLTIFGLSFDYYHKGICYRRDPLVYPYDGILSKQDWGRAFTELYEQNSLSPVWNKVFKRSILVQNGLELNPEMFLYEDFEFVLRYLQYCDNIWNVPQVIYYYRQSDGCENGYLRMSRIESLTEFVKPFRGLLENHPDVFNRMYLMLIQQKLYLADIETIKRICCEFEGGHLLFPENGNKRMDGDNLLIKQIANNKYYSIWFSNCLVRIRHYLAIRVKYILHAIGCSAENLFNYRGRRL